MAGSAADALPTKSAGPFGRRPALLAAKLSDVSEIESAGDHNQATGERGALERAVRAGRLDHAASNHAEASTRDVSVRTSEVRMVEQIEYLRAERELVALFNWKGLEYGCVEVGIPGAKKRISPHISEARFPETLHKIGSGEARSIDGLVPQEWFRPLEVA